MNLLYSQIMKLIEKIRAATRPMHEELDNAMMPYIKGLRSTEDYNKLLVAFYGFFKPVYERIDAHLQTSLLPDYSTRRKPQDILDNLLLLQYHQPIVKLCIHLPAINNNASAFGALYVMEGSTLGGLMIKKMIAEQTSLPDEELSFFAGYGKQTRERWNVFIEATDQVKGNAEEEQAVRSASDTFVCFKEWLHTVYS